MIYIHKEPESKIAKRDKYILRKIGANRKLILELQTGRFVNKKPAGIRRKFRKEFDIQIREIAGRKVWIWSVKNSSAKTKVLYLHGGAYIHNILRVHWNMIAWLVRETGAVFYIPDYPLAPECTYLEAYHHVEAVWDDMSTGSETEEAVFMGDSAGGGLALGLAQKLMIDGKALPEQLILLSPWLDVTMSNPRVREIEGRDILLRISGLIQAGKFYAGDTDTTHPMISPINGLLRGLPLISTFTGTSDILNADARQLQQIQELIGKPYNHFEYPKMFHGWMAIVHMPEATHALEQIRSLIKP